MALEVPAESTKYTTVYANWKGVDYTSDPSLVYKRRSPTGVNMMPTLDGSPVKRPGWKRVLDSKAFTELSPNYEVETFTIDTLRSFVLSGLEHLIIFTNVGVYIYTEKGLARICDPMDANRSFFFEGGATAGYYLYGTDTNDASDPEGNGDNVIYVYGFKEGYIPTSSTTYSDDEGFYCDKMEPTIPRIITGRLPTGGGNALQNVNMLTTYRTEDFLGDTTSTAYLTSSPIRTDRTVKVERINASGGWDVVSTDEYTVMDTSINFNATGKAKNAPRAPGEDNIRITYSTGKTSKQTAEQQKSFKAETFKKYGEKTYKMELKNTPYKKVNSKSQWYVPDAEVKIKLKTGSWKTLDAKYYKITRKTGGKGQLAIYVSKKGFPSLTSSSKIKSGAFSIKIKYPYLKYEDKDNNPARDAFYQCRCVAIYGSGIINQVFMSGSLTPKYTSRVWYSAVSDPTYFPELNYFEAGSDDTRILGLTKAGDYLGVVKEGVGANAAVYIAYPTSFNDNTAYAVKNAVHGIGAISSRTFSLLNGEPLFLSPDGVYAIYASADEEEERQIRNRSYFLNKKIKEEDNLETAFSFVHDGIYYLCVNDHVYLLDSSQQTSWANAKTNLQYECYYWEGVPAVAFGERDDKLYFAHEDGSLCVFKGEEDSEAYADGETKESKSITETVDASTADGYIETFEQEDIDLTAGTTETKVFDTAPIRIVVKGAYGSHTFDYGEESLAFVVPARIYYDGDKTLILEASNIFNSSVTVYDWHRTYTNSIVHEFEHRPLADIQLKVFTGATERTVNLTYGMTRTVSFTESGDDSAGTVVYNGATRVTVTKTSGTEPLVLRTAKYNYNDAETYVIDGVTYILRFTNSGTMTGAHIAIPPTYAGTIYLAHVTVADDGTVTLQGVTVDEQGNVSFASDCPASVRTTVETIGYDTSCNVYRTMTELRDLVEAQPVVAEWSTIMDNDGATQYFKNLQKKGCLVSLPTFDYSTTSAKVYLRVDDKEEKLVASASFPAGNRPKDIHLRKKVKKYKRLQIIVRSDTAEPFGINEITKVYTMGNFSKNRG